MDCSLKPASSVLRLKQHNIHHADIHLATGNLYFISGSGKLGLALFIGGIKSAGSQGSTDRNMIMPLTAQDAENFPPPFLLFRPVHRSVFWTTVRMALIPSIEQGFGNVAFSSVWGPECSNPELETRPRHLQFAKGWVSDTVDGVAQGEWAQVTFPFLVKIVKVTIKGRGCPDLCGSCEQWVTLLQLMTTDLRTPANPQDQTSPPKWELVCDQDPNANPPNNPMFIGNTDSDTAKSFDIDPQNGGRAAQAIRIVPTACHGHCSMRFEVYVRLL